MTTEQEPTRPAKRHEQIANACGIAAISLGFGGGLFYPMVINGVLDPPPGLTGMWTIAVISLAFVKINTWIVDRRVSVAEDRHAAELAEVLVVLRAIQTVLNEGDDVTRATLARTGQFLDEQSNGSVTLIGRSRHGS